MGFGSNCRIFNGQVDYIVNSKLSIADMWLISLDRVTYGYGIVNFDKRNETKKLFYM